MIVVPADMPLTMPLVAPTVPTAVLPLLQVPPAVPSASGRVLPAQTGNTPVMAAGSGLTVTVVVDVQPEPGIV